MASRFRIGDIDDPRTPRQSLGSVEEDGEISGFIDPKSIVELDFFYL
jgi:hypothetical protein